MIVLLTDFGLEGPYIGQVKAALLRDAPGIPVIDLFSDLPPFDAQGAAYLLAAYADQFPEGTVFVGVVDPGVGSSRGGAVVCADGRWYVGPDNGLLTIAARRAANPRWWDITWHPAGCAASFHGRDVFAPIAAGLARGEAVPGVLADPAQCVGAGWPDDLFQVVYLDRFGNAMTGARAEGLADGDVVEVAGRTLPHASTFSDVPRGEGFWYANANGLLELAVNQGRADRDLGLTLGTAVSVVRKGSRMSP
ncbi:MAG: SAM-dependent chlorinase/fluorinase [Gammaproteobacteria bacterium]